MKPAPFDYVRPASVAEACRMLAEAGGGATVIAGGQSLMPLLNLRMSQPFMLVDVAGIAEFAGIRANAEGVWIGPATRQADALADPVLQRELPLLTTALAHVGHHQTRNRGTVGGSIALGEPAAEMPAVAVALGARIELASVRGTRLVGADEFYLGPYMTGLEPDELVTGIVYPAWAADHVVLFREVARRPGDFALTGFAGALELTDGTISRAGLAWLAMGPTPVRARQAEAALIGADPAKLDCEAIAQLALAETAPFDDQHASAEYRRTVGRRIVAKLLREIFGERLAA